MRVGGRWAGHQRGLYRLSLEAGCVFGFSTGVKFKYKHAPLPPNNAGMHSTHSITAERVLYCTVARPVPAGWPHLRWIPCPWEVALERLEIEVLAWSLDVFITLLHVFVRWFLGPQLERREQQARLPGLSESG